MIDDTVYCKETVYPNDRWGSFHPHRCTRKAAKDGFCKMHHPDSVSERRQKSMDRYEQKLANSPYTRLGIAHEKIAELKNAAAIVCALIRIKPELLDAHIDEKVAQLEKLCGETK